MTAPVATKLGVVIREAAHADIPRIVDMGLHFLRSTVYASHLTENQEQMEAIAHRLITEDTGALFVADRNSELVGMIGVMAFLHPLSGDLCAGEMFWFVVPEGRTSSAGLRLLARAEDWARELGCATLQMIAPTPDVERMYERRGFQRVEVAYQKLLGRSE